MMDKCSRCYKECPIGVLLPCIIDGESDIYCPMMFGECLQHKPLKKDGKPKTEESLGQGAAGSGALRMDLDKNRLDLIPPEWTWALGDVMTQGAKKYEARNWEKGMDWSSMIRAMKSHMLKFEAGQLYDGAGFDKETGDTGCHEMALVAWNALALLTYSLRGIGNDNVTQNGSRCDLFKEVNAATSEQRGNKS